MKTNYQSFRDKIREADPADAPKLEKALDRLWDAGIFTVAEFQRLDALICNKNLKL